MIYVRRLAGMAALLFVLGACGRSGEPSSTDNAEVRHDLPVNLKIVVEDADGSTRVATAHCIGELSGTGYLEASAAAGSACTTANISEPVSDFLQARGARVTPRSLCAVSVRMARELPEAPSGRATITGVYDGKRITRRIDAIGGGACDSARWKLMQPLFTPTEDALVLVYPDDVEWG